MIKSIICIIVGLILILISGPASSGERDMDEILDQLMAGYSDTAIIGGEEYSCSEIRRSLNEISMRAFMEEAPKMTEILAPTFMDPEPMSFETFVEILTPSINKAATVAIEGMNSWMVQCMGETLTDEELKEFKEDGVRDIIKGLHPAYGEYLRYHSKIHKGKYHHSDTSF